MKKQFLKAIIIGGILSASLNAADDPLASFPTHFPGIPMTQVRIADIIVGFRIDEFPELERNRNHWGVRADGFSIKHLVLHYTEGNARSTLTHFTANIPEGRASAHYVITETEGGVAAGIPVQVVPEECRAWHAGDGFWRKTGDFNSSSIGIEHVNRGKIRRGEIKEWVPFDPKQIEISGILCRDIVARHHIRPQDVVGHSDIAPGRKPDPGPLFPWGRLHREFRVGAWLADDERSTRAIVEKYSPREPLPTGISPPFLLTTLQQYGYQFPSGLAYLTPDNAKVVREFKAHFSQNQHPERYTHPVDEADMLWAWSLVAKYGPCCPIK